MAMHCNLRRLRRSSSADVLLGGVLLVCLLAGHKAVAEPVGAAGNPSEPHAAAWAVLLDRCIDCHGADGAESGLRLDSRAGLLKGGDFGPAVVLGKGATSELIRRVTSGNADETMPPDGPRLSANEVAALTVWIDAEAPWPGSDDAAVEDTRDPRLDHWAWQPIASPAVPPPVAEFSTLPGVEVERNPIDFFVRAKLAEQGLEPSPVADRRTLIRRLAFDLTGLPPTPEEIEAFVNDSSPQAYEQLVTRLLDSPRYGERWAWHWLDVVHYGDTHGYDKDKLRPNSLWKSRLQKA